MIVATHEALISCRCWPCQLEVGLLRLDIKTTLDLTAMDRRIRAALYQTQVAAAWRRGQILYGPLTFDLAVDGDQQGYLTRAREDVRDLEIARVMQRRIDRLTGQIPGARSQKADAVQCPYCLAMVNPYQPNNATGRHQVTDQTPLGAVKEVYKVTKCCYPEGS